MKVLGIDIGTTTISFVVMDEKSYEALESYTFSNQSNIEENGHKLQDPEKIVAIVKSAVCTIRQKHQDIRAMGFTGQMHGILYTDARADAVSPLYTWQDESAGQIYQQGKSYCAYMWEQTGLEMSAGFGLATHFYLQQNGKIPKNAVKIGMIADYVAARIARCDRFGKEAERFDSFDPVIHSSNAASLGLYDVKNNCFFGKALEALHILPDFLPRVVKWPCTIGQTPDGIDIFVSIGDNQASFLGAVKDPATQVLLNIGTGAQISCRSDKIYTDAMIETRPYIGDTYLLAASSLCGGRAYAMLEQFFRQVLKMAGEKERSLYDAMEMADFALGEPDEALLVDPSFAGSRSDAKKRGGIRNITVHNFTPGHLIHGFLQGILNEFLPAYHIFCTLRPVEALIVAGNAMRKNACFRQLAEKTFQTEVNLADHAEEAALGAAKYAAGAQ